MLIQNKLLPSILYSNENRYFIKNAFQGQYNINMSDSKCYINLLNNDNITVWQQLDKKPYEVNFDTGSSFLLGYKTPQIITHNLSRFPNYIHITINEKPDDVGNVYLDTFDDIKFIIINTGNAQCNITWFAI